MKTQIALKSMEQLGGLVKSGSVHSPVWSLVKRLLEEGLDLTFEEEDGATFVRVSGSTERIWLTLPDDMPPLRLDHSITKLPAPFDLSEEVPVSRRPIDRVRFKSKYLLGSTIVNLVFLSGPTKSWDNARKTAFKKYWVDEAHNIINTKLKRTDKVPFEGSKISFTVVTEDSYCGVDPISGDYFKIGVNIKSYLKDKGYFSGTINDESGYPASDEFKQATYEAVNDMRDKYSTDWGYFVFAVPDGAKGRQHAWEEPGLYILYEDLTQPAYPWVTAHETLHMFGAGDLYVDDPKTVDKVNRCQLAVGGLYDKASVYCELPDGYESMMGSGMRDATKSWREQILATTAEQMSLILDSGVYRPLKEKYRQSYVLNDYNFKSEGGIILTGDVIRKNGKLTVEISGQSKMNPFYSPHGPDGDANTVVGNDHILPGNNFSCCVGHWISIDGSQSTPWFHVGSGATFTAPFTAYFCWNVNDKKGGFGDNSGNMTVTLTTSFRDNYGSAYVYKASRAIGADSQMVEPTQFDILSEDITE